MLLIGPLLISLLISLFLTPHTIRFFRSRGWVEDPKKKKHPKVIHTVPVPRGGGLPILTGIIGAVLLFLPLDHHLVAIMGACLFTVAVGLVDDVLDISPYIRLVANIAAALIVVSAGIGINYFNNPLGSLIHLDRILLPIHWGSTTLAIPIIKSFFTIIWIVWCMNIVGWSGGVEGQLPGFVAISAIIIGLLSLKFSQDIAQWPVIILSGAVAGAYLGFLAYNFFPQQIMPGYSGKSLAGLILAVLAILSGAKVATAILVLAVPMVDGSLTIIRRLIKRKSPFWGDAEHLHHLLLKLGWSKTRIAILYWFFSFLTGVIVLNLNSKQKFYFIAILFVIIGAAIWIIKQLVEKKEGED